MICVFISCNTEATYAVNIMGSVMRLLLSELQVQSVAISIWRHIEFDLEQVLMCSLEQFEFVFKQ